MADITKLKRRNTLGAPPSPEEASRNLTAPEIAPTHLRAVTTAVPSPTAPQRMEGQGRIDGRTLRKTGRTVQFATRVSMEFDDRLRRLAQRDGLKLCEVLECALEAYEASRR
jgi:hypothetical protein